MVVFGALAVVLFTVGALGLPPALAATVVAVILVIGAGIGLAADHSNQVYVDVRASQDRPGLGVVTVVSRPKAPFQFSDWGMGVRRVSRLLSVVPGGFPAQAPSGHR